VAKLIQQSNDTTQEKKLSSELFLYYFYLIVFKNPEIFHSMIGKSHASFCHHLESVSYRLFFTSEIT
jgi:hypothetical protein